MVGTVAGAVEIAVGVLTLVGMGGGAYHRFVIKPIAEEAGDAMATARTADKKAEDNAAELDALDDDLRQSLEDLHESMDRLADGLEQQRREYRGQSYRMYVITKAMNEAEDTPDVPVPDEDEFLRGGEGATFRGGDD